MKNILIQLDTSPHPSTFDRVVAVDADVDELFSYGNITAENVTSLVHGGMFTRGPNDLKHTAVFIGGEDVAAGEAVLKQVCKTFFGPVRMSVMMDSNGSNTTAAAAVLSARKHIELSGSKALVLGGTGPVGLRAAHLLAMEGASVLLASRSQERAESACETVRSAVPSADVSACVVTAENQSQTLADVQVLIAAGAPGVQFLKAEDWQSSASLKVAIDLNAVPPLGLDGLEVTDKAKEFGEVVAYGAIGVGGRKMKIHKAAIKRLFTANDLVLDTEAIYRIGEEIL